MGRTGVETQYGKHTRAAAVSEECDECWLAVCGWQGQLGAGGDRAAVGGRRGGFDVFGPEPG